MPYLSVLGLIVASACRPDNDKLDVCREYERTMSACFQASGLDHGVGIGYQDECERRTRNVEDIAYFTCVNDQLSAADCSLNKLDDVARTLRECAPP
jgi:hypothetical protein